jgi:hypothetical protein
MPTWILIPPVTFAAFMLLLWLAAWAVETSDRERRVRSRPARRAPDQETVADFPALAHRA